MGMMLALILLPSGIMAQNWTASEPEANGTFYLFNVGKEAFVYGANDWGKRVSTNQYGGVPVTLISNGSQYLISTEPLYTGKYIGFNSGKTFFYLDKADVVWDFIPVDGLTNTYKMKATTTSGSTVKYMVADASSTITTASSSEPTSNMGYWQLLSKEQLIDYMTENASADNGIDATWAIQNFYFGYESNMELWQGVSSVVGQSEQPYNECVERWNMTSFDVYQEITGMPNGVYTLELQGFYRMGNSNNDAAASAAAREAGNEQLNAKYYINDAEAPLKSILDYSHSSSNDSKYNTSNAVTVNGVNYYVPNNAQRAAYCFLYDEYWNEPLRAVVTDGTLRIGVRKSEGDTNDWAAFDNLRLTYYGPVGVDALIEAAVEKWHDKYDDIIDQAWERGNYDDLLDPANIAEQCTDEASLAAYESTIWQAVCDVLQDPDNASVRFDITSLITNPNLDTDTSGWTATAEVRYSSAGIADLFGQTNASFTQTLPNMPAGTYVLKAQSNYRTQSWRRAVAAYQCGESEVKGYLVLGSASVPVCNLYDQPRFQPARLEGNAGGALQGMVSDSKVTTVAAFGIGQYWNQVTNVLTSDGDLTIGTKVENGLSENWLCFDNFCLYYGETDIPVDLTRGLPPDDTKATTVTTGITLNAGTYNKVCLPFDLDATQTSDAFSNAYILAGVTTDGAGQLVPVSTIKAGKPYFVTVDANKTLTVNNVMVKVAQPDSLPVMWEGAATVGTFNGFTFTVNRSDGVAAEPTYTPVDWQNMSFTVNQENWRARRYLSEVTYAYDGSVPSKIDYYNVGKPAPLDHPHSVYIPVPENNSALTVTVSKNSDYSDAEVFTFAAGTTWCEVPNLIPQNTYYYKVEGGGVLTKGQFNTEGHLRMIKTLSGFNIRDLGGWENLDGNRVRYGKVFRGGELNYTHPVFQSDLNELMRLGVGAELDFRREDETNNESPTTSALDNDVPYLYMNFDYSNLTYDNDVNRQQFKRAFEFTLQNLREEKSVYFHCRIGADRTGAFGLLLDGLCGLEIDKLCKEYELTSFSEADTRKWDADGTNTIKTKLNYIKSLPGSTLQQKFFYYVHNELEIPTQDIIDFINIMVDGENSIVNSNLAFNNADNEYHQSTSTISAICAAGSEIVSGAKAQLSDGTSTVDVAMSVDGITISFEDVALEKGKEYTLTIPAESVEKGGTYNSEAVELHIKTPIVFDGDYYIYDEEREQFMSRNRNYGTRGVLDNFGIPATFTTDINNITTIMFLDNNLYYGDQDGYTDKNSGEPHRWTLEPQGDGSFLFFLNDGINKYVTMSYDGTNKYWFNRLRTTSEATPTPFVLKTLEEHDDIVAQKKEANILAAAAAAGIQATSLSEFEAALADYTEVQSSAVINSADAGNTDNWVLSEPWARNENGNGYYVGDYGGELYLKNGSISQTVTVPHPGLYKLTLNALMRQGHASTCCEAGYKGFTMSYAYVSINDTYYAQVPDWFSDRLSDDSPVTTTTFKAMTDEDPTKYSMEVYAYIDETKTATITLTVPGYVPFQWCIFNHWKLYEYNPSITISEEATEVPTATGSANVTLVRTLKPGIWNTLSLPFDLTADQLANSPLAGSIIYNYNSQETTSTEVKFTSVNYMTAKRPYLVKLPDTVTEDIVNPTFTNVTVKSGEGVSLGGDNQIKFVAQIYNKSLQGIENVCYLATNGYMKKLSATGSIKGLRSYFILPPSTDPTGVKMLFDTPTGIEEVELEDAVTPNSIYDLSGRRLNATETLAPGIYIINGKKVMIK